MRKLVLLLGFLASACATQCPPAANLGPTVVQFSCDSAETLTVTFAGLPDTAHIEEQGYPALTLPALPAGSGYRYGADGVELRGRGAEARLTRPGAGERLCHETH